MQAIITQRIEHTIGNTPIIELDIPFLAKEKSLFLKLEFFNPTFSIKDRAALGLIKDAFIRGNLKSGGTIIEATSGNLGKSLAMLGAALGFKVILVIDPKVSQSVINCCKAYGSEIIMVNTPDKNGGYQQSRINKVKELLKKHPDAYWPNQYDNQANPNFHYHQTATEILNLNVDAVCGAVSTGGHLCGIARNLLEYKPHIKILGCDINGSAIFNNSFKPYLLNGVGLAWKSANTDLKLFNHTCNISDQDAISCCHYLAKNHGVLVGGSGGLATLAALGYLHQNYADKILVIIADSGHNYLSQIYDQEWLNKHQVHVLDTEVLLNQINKIHYRRQVVEEESYISRPLNNILNNRLSNA